MKWQSIETAPCTGEEILVLAHDKKSNHTLINIVAWNTKDKSRRKSKWFITETEEYLFPGYVPVYWMPLPELPPEFKPEEEQPDPVEDEPTRFTGGKYKGKLVRDVMKFDLPYVDWAARAGYIHLTDEDVKELHHVVDIDQSRAIIYGRNAYSHDLVYDRVVSVETKQSWTGATYQEILYASGKKEEQIISLNCGDDE